MPAAKMSLILLIALMMTPPAHSDFIPENPDIEAPEVIAAARKQIEAEFRDSEVQPMSRAEVRKILNGYQHLDPHRYINTSILEKTILYFDKNKDKFPNKDYITIVDFTPRSDKHRLFVIDMKTGAVERYHTTHGVGSDKDADGYAEKFLNVPNSGASNLGFGRTTDPYVGKYGRAVRMDGLSSTNTKMRERAIVYHGWDQVYEKDVIQGMSHGCITLEYGLIQAVVDKVKGGSLVNMAFIPRK